MPFHPFHEFLNQMDRKVVEFKKIIYKDSKFSKVKHSVPHAFETGAAWDSILGLDVDNLNLLKWMLSPPMTYTQILL